MMSEHYCEEHGIEFTEKHGKDGVTFWSHKADSGWCNEPKEEKKVQPSTKPPVTNEKPSDPTGAARGMSIKEIGDMMRAGLLGKVFGETIASSLVAWYRTEILAITRINYDGKNLPNFK